MLLSNGTTVERVTVSSLPRTDTRIIVIKDQAWRIRAEINSADVDSLSKTETGVLISLGKSRLHVVCSDNKEVAGIFHLFEKCECCGMNFAEESHTCPRAEEYGTTEEERSGECNCCENCTIDCQLDI